MNKRLILILGGSDSGKTTLSYLLKSRYKEINIIHTDRLIKDITVKLELYKKGEPLSVGVIMSEHREKIIEHLMPLIEEKLSETNSNINIIEGIVTELSRDLRSLKLPYINLRGNINLRVNPKELAGRRSEFVVNGLETIKVGGIACETVKPSPTDIEEDINNKGYESQIDSILSQSKILKKFIEASLKDMPSISEAAKKLKYQSFTDFGNSASSSSVKKLEIIKPFMDVHPWSGELLDVGCNAGYFCFEFHKSNNRLSCLGVDQSSQISSAEYFNNFYYHYDKVKFLKGDILKLNLEEKRFKFVLALSVFHYFREDQLFFLSKCKKWLRNNGYLMIEIATSVSAKPTTPNHVEKFSRGVDKAPCYFPSEKTFENWANETGFSVVKKEESVYQNGDPHPRILYILKNGKIQAKYKQYDAPDEIIKEGRMRNNGREIFMDGEWIKYH